MDHVLLWTGLLELKTLLPQGRWPAKTLPTGDHAGALTCCKNGFPYAVPAALSLLRHGASVSVSGPLDHVVGRVADDHGEVRRYLIRVGGGSALLPRVTASGCSLGALVAAYTAVAALVAAHVHFALAAEVAQAQASGPGSFVPAFLDGLDSVNGELIRAKAQLYISLLDV